MFSKCTLQYLLVLATVMSPAMLLAQIPSAKELLTKSIAHHDPNNTWEQERHHFNLIETRPGGSDRKTNLIVDLPSSFFESHRSVDGHSIKNIVKNNEVQITFDGSDNLDSTIVEKYRLTASRALSMRNYYIYLWGLPMKLRDPGTIINEDIQDEKFNGQEAWKMKVTYDPEVGNDIWYFYFDKESYALIGYRFYHDESANDGEYITLAGEAKVGALLLPAERAWYMHKDDKYLGTDKIDVSH